MRIIPLLLIFTACGSARVHYQDTRGGIIALKGQESSAMEEAEEHMRAHCGPGGYVVMKRDTVVVGREAFSNEQTDYVENTNKRSSSDAVSENVGDIRVKEKDKRSSRTTAGSAQTNTYSGEKDVFEVRLHYSCGGHQGTTPAPVNQAPVAPATPDSPPPAPIPERGE